MKTPGRPRVAPRADAGTGRGGRTRQLPARPPADGARSGRASDVGSVTTVAGPSAATRAASTTGTGAASTADTRAASTTGTRAASTTGTRAAATAATRAPSTAGTPSRSTGTRAAATAGSRATIAAAARATSTAAAATATPAATTMAADVPAETATQASESARSRERGQEPTGPASPAAGTDAPPPRRGGPTKAQLRAAAERQRAAEILARLEAANPDWGPTLTFRSPFELLVATILAAGARDDHINQITPGLFAKYPGPADFVRAEQEELEREIKPSGYFRQKAKALKAASEGLLEEFGGEVPRDIEQLVRLRGVGRKTASIVVGASYGVPSIGVDRHVERTTQRLRLTRQKDPDKIEMDLRALFEESDWVKATWCLVLHGRRVCTPTPRCPECPVRDLCPYPKKTV